MSRIRSRNVRAWIWATVGAEKQGMDKHTHIRPIQQVRDALDGIRCEDATNPLEEFGSSAFPKQADRLTLAYWLRTQGSDDGLPPLGQHLSLWSRTRPSACRTLVTPQSERGRPGVGPPLPAAFRASS
jgi:hypothetical protein